MTYSFDTELAQKLGVNEAILLQNIVFWLLKNKANGANYYDGRYWTYNSHKAFKELFPFWTENQIRRILESLFEKGVILKGDYNSSPYDKTKWYALSDKYAYLIGLNSQSDMANLPDGDDENAGCLIGTDNKQQIINTDIKEDTNVSKKDENNSDIKLNIDELYKMYPSKCPKRNVSLGKCFKDKERLKKLLKNHSYEMLKFTIEKEISEKYNKSYMSNFSTFLNNLPDYGYNDNKSNEEIIDEKETKDNGNLVINGIVYR